MAKPNGNHNNGQVRQVGVTVAGGLPPNLIRNTRVTNLTSTSWSLLPLLVPLLKSRSTVYGKIVSTNFICVCSFHLRKLEKVLPAQNDPIPNPYPATPIGTATTGTFPLDAEALLIKVIADDKWQRGKERAPLQQLDRYCALKARGMSCGEGRRNVFPAGENSRRKAISNLTQFTLR